LREQVFTRNQSIVAPLMKADAASVAPCAVPVARTVPGGRSWRCRESSGRQRNAIRPVGKIGITPSSVRNAARPSVRSTSPEKKSARSTGAVTPPPRLSTAAPR
jgi:hypothetical protein